MRTSRLAARSLVAALFLAAVVSGCGGDGDPVGTPAPPEESTTTAAAPETTAVASETTATTTTTVATPSTTSTTATASTTVVPAGPTVTVDAYDFVPGTIEVVAGSTVAWTTTSPVSHTVTDGERSSPTGRFDEALPEGSTATATFPDAGRFPYFCRIHAEMVGEVLVS